MTPPRFRAPIVATAIISCLTLPTACAYYVPTVRNDTSARFVLQTSAKHGFLDRVAHIDEESSQLLVYGSVTHHHETCRSEGHVRLIVMDPKGQPWAERSLPIVNRGGRRGWPGADFRTRIDGVPPKDSQIHLSFHDEECSKEGVFDCGDGEMPQGSTDKPRAEGRS